jgi:hypothetical protein
MKLTTTPEQLLTGLTVGTQTKTHCQWCEYKFYEGDVATILVSKSADSDRWAIHRAYCAGCDPSAIAGPTLGCTELLAQCRLGIQTDAATQQIELVVLEPDLIAASEPAESQSALETDEDTDPATGTQSPSSDGVETETLPPSLRVPPSHRHSVTGDGTESADPLEERPGESDGNAD